MLNDFDTKLVLINGWMIIDFVSLLYITVGCSAVLFGGLPGRFHSIDDVVPCAESRQRHHPVGPFGR